MARDGKPSRKVAIARFAKQHGVPAELVERMLDEEVERRIAADLAERQRRPGRRPEGFRDLWIMHKIEWHRAQVKGLKQALREVSKSRKKSVDTVRKIYKKTKYPEKRRNPTGLEKLMGVTPLTARELRDLYRRDPGALVKLMEGELEQSQKREKSLRREAERLQKLEDDLRSRGEK